MKLYFRIHIKTLIENCNTFRSEYLIGIKCYKYWGV